MGIRGRRRHCVLMVIASFTVGSSTGRSWRDIATEHEVTVDDVAARFYRIVEDLHYKSMMLRPESASLQLEVFDRQPTTIKPSPSPSSHPSQRPSPIPSQRPTSHPTVAPTRHPTISPTKDPYRPNDIPVNPDPWYFDYNTTAEANHGPGKLVVQSRGGFFTTTFENNQWGTVQPRQPFDYWDEFTANAGYGAWKQTLEIHQPWRNKCASGNRQSPIDLAENGGVCREHHEVRSLPGDFGLRGRRVKKQIHPNKLRLLYQRRPCSDLTNVACQEPDPPAADFPSGWAGFADVIHIDFKVKSEHSIKGETFDAGTFVVSICPTRFLLTIRKTEMQIFHIHPGRRRLAAQAVLIRAQKDGYNYYFQEALDNFQRDFDDRTGRCRRRKLEDGQSEYESWAKFYTFGGAHPRKRFDFGGGPWDPHHPMLVPTIYFYRYDGSLTEPPCGEFVTWWVADRPMIIGLEQLDQMKQLLFLNVGTDCRKTTVQHGRSVARPIQKTNNRPVWRCKPSNYGPD